MTESNYSAYKSYNNSKLANVAYAQFLQEKLEPKGITVVSLHPGTVNTELIRHFSSGFVSVYRGIGRLTLKTPWQGCQTTMECVLANDLVKGGYYSDCKYKVPNGVLKKEGWIGTFMDKTYKTILENENGKVLAGKLNAF